MFDYFGKTVFAVLKSESWYDKEDNLMTIHTDSMAVFANESDAVQYVLEEAASLELYALKLGLKSEKIETSKKLDKTWPNKYLDIAFEENRAEHEKRCVRWRIQQTWYKEES